jgi:threonine synthase
MRFISTRGETEAVTASEAILRGLAPDGGLYVPAFFPPLSAAALDPEAEYPQVAVEVLAPFFAEDELEAQLPQLCTSAFDFPVPLTFLSGGQAVLELYHGPTAAFKDFGARFLAAAMEALQSGSRDDLHILVATSGDTGGAVASAFYGRRGVQVRILFPEGRVSGRQEKQLTCWGGNVASYAVRGAFDDCQKVVKRAFRDERVRAGYRLSSANSINLGRLLPQTVYYVWSSVRFRERTGREPIVVVPSGNVGNSVGAYWAREMGAPIRRIDLAVNANRVIPDFLDSGEYRPRPSLQTLANAMDVGDPSNMERLRALYPDIETLRRNVRARSVDDEAIRATIGELWKEQRYAVCPHTAAGERVRRDTLEGEPSIVAATAHPAKFETIVEPLIGEEVPVPENLRRLLEAESRYSTIEPAVEALFPDVFSGE